MARRNNDNSFSRTVISHYPVIRYTANGQEITIKHNAGKGYTSKYKVGDEVKIYCNDSDPKQYYIKGYYKIISLFFGVILILASILILIYLLKRFMGVS